MSATVVDLIMRRANRHTCISSIPRSSSFSVHFLHRSGRCYKAEIYAILFPLRCAIAWYLFQDTSSIPRVFQDTCNKKKLTDVLAHKCCFSPNVVLLCIIRY